MKFRFNFDEILIRWLFYVLPFADLLTGALLHLRLSGEGGLASPSQLFRMFFFALAVPRLRRNQMAAILCVIAICSISEYFGAFTHQSSYGLGCGFANMFKLAYICTAAFLMTNWVVGGTYSKLQILSCALNGAMIYASNVILAVIFGFGEKTYGAGTFGTKGFVPSNNGLSLTLGSILIISLLCQATLWEKLRSWVILVATLFIGAKASIVFIAIYLVVTYLRAKLWLKVMAIGVVIGLYVNYIDKILKTLSVVFDVVMFRYNHSRGGILHFLASGRDNYIRFAFEGFGSNLSSLFRMIFGEGSFVSFHNLTTMEALHGAGAAVTSYETLETDLFDIYFQYGILMSILYLTILFAIGLRFLRARQWIFLLDWILIGCFSILAGHTVFNGMSATLIILLVAMSIHSPNKFKEPQPNAVH